MYTIKKVLNSSVVLVTDAAGKDSILLGKGIGYGKKAGESVPDDGANRVFVPADGLDGRHAEEVFSAADARVTEVTQEIVSEAERLLGIQFPASIYPLLADHLSFAIDRAKQGVRITNRVYWEIKNYYPDEFRAGEAGIGLVRDRLGIQLPEEEAANLAFHFSNARSPESDYDTMRYAKVMGQLINLVVFSLNRTIDTKSIHYLRFVTHVKYFVERYFSGSMLADDDGVLFAHVSATNPRELEIARKIASYMEKTYGKPLPQQELLYLLIHIARLAKA